VMVRCGSCRTQFDVPGPGRFSCPVCGSVNMVRAAAGAPGAPPPPANSAPPPPRPPDPPSPKITCESCGFKFIVGSISLAKCPNCGAEVNTGIPSEEA
jgi:LSD1 subclass zinc finger protein